MTGDHTPVGDLLMTGAAAEGRSQKLDSNEDPDELTESSPLSTLTLAERHKRAVRTREKQMLVKTNLKYDPDVGEMIRLETPEGQYIAEVVVSGYSRWSVEQLFRSNADFEANSIQEVLDTPHDPDDIELTLGTELDIIHFLLPWVVENGDWDVWRCADETTDETAKTEETRQ